MNTQEKTSQSWAASLGINTFPEDEDGVKRKLAFLGYFPCPIRGEIRESLAEMIGGRFSDEPGGGSAAPWYVPGGCGGVDVYEDLWKVTDPDLLPEVILSIDFGDYWRPEFRKRFVDTGLFESVAPPEASPAFKNAGFVSGAGGYTFFAAFPNILLVDNTRLDGRKPPESWEDLLKPEWRGDLTLGGNKDEVATILLLHLWKKYGDQAVLDLIPQVKALRHPSQMAKLAGSGNPEGSALYMSNWFFADSCTHTDKTSIVIPKEGALASPIYLLARKDRGPAAQAIIDRLFSPEVATICRERWFPTPHAPSPGMARRFDPLENLPLTWLGWDFVLSHDMEALRNRLEKLFMKDWKGLVG